MSIRSILGALALLVACSGGSSTSSGGGGNGSDDGGTSSTAPKGTPAPKGTSAGAPVTQSIDAAGGKVTSGDGRLELTIPAGALAAATAIGVEPITNTLPNGEGSAYRLSPEGATFAAPVTLTLHLSDLEAASLATSFLATQHADGIWYAQPNLARDAAAKTLSVTTTHFSDWAGSKMLHLVPESVSLRTNATKDFSERDAVALGDPATPRVEALRIEAALLGERADGLARAVQRGEHAAFEACLPIADRLVALLTGLCR